MSSPVQRTITQKLLIAIFITGAIYALYHAYAMPTERIAHLYQRLDAAVYTLLATSFLYLEEWMQSLRLKKQISTTPDQNAVATKHLADIFSQHKFACRLFLYVFGGIGILFFVILRSGVAAGDLAGQLDNKILILHGIITALWMFVILQYRHANSLEDFIKSPPIGAPIPPKPWHPICFSPYHSKSIPPLLILSR